MIQHFISFTIKTKQKGNFSNILKLASFQIIKIPTNEIPFISEVLKILGNTTTNLVKQSQSEKITQDNVFDLFEKHQKIDNLCSNLLAIDIDFISSNFFELCENHSEEIKNLPLEILKQIFGIYHCKTLFRKFRIFRTF